MPRNRECLAVTAQYARPTDCVQIRSILSLFPCCSIFPMYLCQNREGRRRETDDGSMENYPCHFQAARKHVAKIALER